VFGVIAAEAMPAASRITLPSGKKIFVSGMNLAWISYAGDVGDTPLDTVKVNSAMKAISDSGANSMRIWLSTDGTKDPKYGSNGLVTGPGSQTTANIQKMLKLAKKNNLVLMLVLLTHNWVNKDINSTILANNKKMLTTDAGLQAYIDNYLIPVVTAIGNDPNLLCWEVFNEPEGMVDGWSSPANTITKAQVQKSVNWIAAAIHQAVPNVLVSNGAATIGTLNWYKDAALNTAGGKANGTLDFYMAHYYGWNGPSNSPFTKNYASWNLDKPLVIGEYASSSWSPATKSTLQDAGNVDTLMTYLDKAGYAGGLGWQYQQDAGDPWLKGFVTFGHSMRQAYRADSNDIKLSGTSSNTFAITVSATNGGTVKSSAVGRVDSAKADTITATATAGYTFTGWTGDTTATGATLIIKSVVKDWSIQANFVPNAGTSLIKGGDFSDNTQWGFYAATGNAATVAYTNDQANVTITTADTLNYHIQLSQGSIALDSGVTYLVTVDAWSSEARKLFIGLSTAETWHYQGGAEISLTATKTTFTVEITPDSSTSAGILQFNLGGSTLPVYIDNVSFVKKSASPVVWNQKVYNNDLVSFNRVGDKIYWGTSNKKAKVFLLDLEGRVIQPSTMNNPIHLNSIPSGTYLFVVNNGVKNQVFKFVK
jgi:uncharacterized repeat protein (TIGR02543 family)